MPRMRSNPARDAQPRVVAAALTAVLLVSTSAPADTNELHRGFAWQIALEKSGFSPGIIDGTIGRKTVLATREFQKSRGLPATGRLDAATAAALRVSVETVIAPYTVRAADLAAVAPVPEDWIERSRMPLLGYESVEAALAERFHCTRALLARLNPGRQVNALQAGDTLLVPAVAELAEIPRGESVIIDLAEKTVRVLNSGGDTVALFHCSIAKSRDKLPTSEGRVEVMIENPTYTFDPKMWPEVKGIDRKLTIASGPRNPVGRCWIGLSLPGYGIHGSPAPEMIGKTGSHGCFRLTNWDALRLAKMIRVGTLVRFTGHAAVATADAPGRR